MDQAIVHGVPLTLLTIAAVQWLKEMGVEGKAARVASLVTGVVIGGGYQLSVAMPADYAGWFGVTVYGLALGLTASGLYDAGKGVVAAAVKPAAR